MSIELPTMANDQKDFMLAGKQTVGVKNPTQLALYLKLITQEYIEVCDAPSDPELLKELNDLLVVTIGAIHSLATEAAGPWAAVHSNNMLKVAFPPILDPDTQKILKSPESIENKPVMMETLKMFIAK